jgi:predicted lipoprotein with Yx(FWY)xxD motif
MRRILLVAALGLLATPAAALPDGVLARKDGSGIIYTDAQDRTLYTYEQDKGGKSTCVGPCAKAWPPLTASDTAAANGDWTTIVRDDGSKQWALKGRPIYAYAKDTPGSVFGDGVGNFAWRMAFEPIFTPPGLIVRPTVLGRTLADEKGMVLYWRTDSKPCIKSCLDTWTPVAAPLAAVGKDDWSVVIREDGTRQWAYRGRALYTTTADIKAGDVAGHLPAEKWEAAILAATAPLPTWVTVQSSDMGEIFADRDGHTLYLAPTELARVKQLMCDDACIAKFWKPVLAAADAKPSGDWSIIADEGGAKVWAYRGSAVFTHTRDTKPGDVGGDKWAAGVGGGGGGWLPITRPRGTDDAP